MDFNDLAWILSLIVAFIGGGNFANNIPTTIALLCISFSLVFLSVSIDQIQEKTNIAIKDNK